MEISLTGTNLTLLGGLIALVLVLFLLRGLLNWIAIIVILVVVLPFFGIGFMGSLDVTSALTGGARPLTAAETELLNIYRQKAGFSEAELPAAQALLAKANRNFAAMTSRELTQYQEAHRKFSLLSAEERTHLSQLLQRQQAAERKFTQADLYRMAELLVQANMSGPEYQAYYSLYQKRLSRIANGLTLSVAEDRRLKILENQLTDALTETEADELRRLYLKRNPTAQGGGLLGPVIQYSQSLVSWAFSSFSPEFARSMPGLEPQIRPAN